MLDLPGVFKHNPENLPNNIPYIKTNWENKNELFLPEMTSSDYKIGIVWGSNKNNTHLYPQKSCNLKFFVDLLKTVEGISFYSLQVGEDSQVLKYWRNYEKIYNLSTQLTYFTVTAAAIAQLDLIITVDTAVAHLAGAMAKPVWLLLPYQADWRWGLSGEHSNWYPTMRLFRQTQVNDWQSVFKTIEQELQKINKTGVEKVVAKIQTSQNPVKNKGFAKTRQQANKKPQSPTSVSKSIQPLGIAWSVDPTTGWGNYGLNLVLQLQRKPGVAPVMLSPANTNYILNPIHKQILSNLAQKQQKWQQLRQIIQNQAVKINLPVLHPLGNDINGGTLNLRGEKNIGVIFFENTNLSNEAIARGKAFDLIIAGSSWNAQVLKDRGLTNIATVLQGIAPNQFHPAPKSDIFRDRFVVFSGGKLEYRKGQDIVIAAFKRFVTRHPEALLLTAWHNFFPQFMQGLETTGNVIGLPEIDSQTKKLALTPWLVKNGIPATNHLDVSPIPNYLMGQVIREADVAVFPNRAEGGTNLVAMESLACGVPTILSTNTGHQDLLGEHCYQLPTQKPVQPTNIFPGVEGWGESNVDEVVEALEQVYQNRSQAQFKGEKAVEFMQDWTWEKQVERLSQAINCR
ncbi:MAG: glycosyltransferase [Cyanobacteria bacterium J083]|nr:MAG: glycosyltransferase [Cyanobacteria bacterium J083]